MNLDSKLEKHLTKTWVVILLALFCNFLWGSAFSFIKKGYSLMAIQSADTASQMLFAGLRFFLAGLLSVLFGSILNGKFIYPKKSGLPKVAVLSLLQTIIQYVFFYVGLAHTTGVKASIIEGTSVFVSLLVAALVFRMEKLTVRKILGCVIGFAGIVLANLNGAALTFDLNFLGDGFIFFSTIAYAFSVVVMKKFSASEDPVMLSGYQFILGGLVMIVIGLVSGGRLTQFSPQAGLVLLYLAFVSAGAYSVWSLLMKYNPVSKIAVYGFTNPVFGVILSALILGESSSLNLLCILALVLVSAGILIVNFRKKNT